MGRAPMTSRGMTVQCARNRSMALSDLHGRIGASFSRTNAFRMVRFQALDPAITEHASIVKLRGRHVVVLDQPADKATALQAAQPGLGWMLDGILPCLP